MRKQATLVLALFVLASVAALAQGRRISTFPYSQPFNFVTSTTTAFPTTNVDGGEFTTDAGTNSTFTTSLTSHGVHNNGGGSLRLQSTGTTGPAGIIWYGDFTARTAGTLSIDWTKVQNPPNGTRTNELRIATNGGSGSTFTDLTGVTWPTFDNSTTPQSGTLTVTLPTTLSNRSDVRIRIYSFNISGSGNHPRVAIDNLAISAAACAAPGQPSLTAISSPNTNRVEMTFGQGTNTDSVLIIRRTGAAPTAVPATGTRYTAGQGLNATDTVVYSGTMPAMPFSNENLQSGTTYYYDIYGFRTCGASYSSPASSSITTLSCAGSPGAITGVTDVARTQTSVTLDYVRSTRTDSVLIIRRLNGSPTVSPSNGTRYSTGQALSSQDTVGYFGPATDLITVGSLQADSLYYFAVYGFQSCNTTYSSPAGVDSARTYCTRSIGNVTDVQVLYTTANSAGLLVTGANDVQNIVVFSSGPDTNRAAPLAGRLYSVGDVVGDDTVRYVGPIRRPIINGLAPATTYQFFALALQPCNYSYSALGDTVSARTLGTCIPLVPGVVDSIRVTRNVPDTLRLSWRRALLADRYLVVARVDSTPTVGPSNGTWYMRGDSLGKAVVLANSADSSVSITGIPRNTALFIRVYAFTNCALTYGASSAVFATATIGTDSSQRFAMKANIIDTIEFGGARIAFAEAPSTDGSILITRRSGHPGTLGIPMQRNNEPLINVVSADRWWQLTRNGLGEFDVRLRFDVTGLPGMQDISDLEIIYRPTTTSSWTDIRTEYFDTTNTGGRAYLYSNVQPFVGEYAIGANSNRNVLPVKLTSFEGYTRGRVNVLRWETASEENNAGFRLSRSRAGSDDAFVTVADYTTDGSLVGAGTSSRAHRYGVVDADASLAPGARYIYRLEEISLDGQVAEIGRVAIEMRAVTGLSAASISPNPTTTDVMTTLRFSVAETGPLAVTLVDVTGATVRTLLAETSVDSGERALAFSTADLAAGTYFCQITTPSGRTVVPVVVTR